MLSFLASSRPGSEPRHERPAPSRVARNTPPWNSKMTWSRDTNLRAGSSAGTSRRPKVCVSPSRSSVCESDPLMESVAVAMDEECEARQSCRETESNESATGRATPMSRHEWGGRAFTRWCNMYRGGFFCVHVVNRDVVAGGTFSYYLVGASIWFLLGWAMIRGMACTVSIL